MTSSEASSVSPTISPALTPPKPDPSPRSMANFDQASLAEGPEGMPQWMIDSLGSPDMTYLGELSITHNPAAVVLSPDIV